MSKDDDAPIDLVDLLFEIEANAQPEPEDSTPETRLAVDILERCLEYGLLGEDDLDDFLDYDWGESRMSVDLIFFSELIERVGNLQ